MDFLEKTKEKYRELRDSKCLHDAKGRHFWERIGIFCLPKTGSIPDLPVAVWRCSQCEKCIVEPLDFMTDADYKTSKS